MLCIPSFRQLGDLTVYPDDAVWTRFYVVPSVPRIRRDESGRPVFLLTVYHTSDQQRAENPSLARGGGFLNFDVQFSPTPQQLESAQSELQQWVDAEYARRRQNPAYASLPEYASTDAPRAELTDPVLSGGSVTMHTTQSDLLVSKRLAGVPAALVAGSTAVFNLDLTEAGASFMRQLFVDESGTGRIDLTPVQIVYDLEMLARLPPVTVTVTGDTQRIHQTMLKVSETTRDNYCTPREIETYRQNGTSSSSLRDTGAVQVRTVKGDALVPDAVVDSLERFAFDTFDKMLEERFLVPEEPPPDEGFAGPPLAGGARTGNALGRYKVRETLSQADMHLEVKLERSQVVKWPTGGEATLETFFAGASREEIQRHVVELTADDFDSLGVTVRALVDFDAQPLQAIEIQAEYTATDQSGRSHSFPAAFTFRSGEVTAQRFDPTIINGQREYRFRHRAIYDDGTPGDYTDWQTTSSRALNVAVADPGKLQLEVSSASLNWEVVRGVRADLVYRDAPGATPLQQSYELSKLTPTRKWERRFNGPMRGQVEVRITYFLTDDKVIEGPTQTLEPTNTLFSVPPPQVDVLNVTLVPAGNSWSDVVQVVASMEYDAGAGRVYDKTFRFTSIEQSAEWTVLLRDPTRRSFRYKTLAIFKSGGKEESGWIEQSGDQAILVEVKGRPRWRVNLLWSLVDFDRTPAVTVTLAYADERKTFSFTGPGNANWELPLAADGRREYIATITWFTSDGQSVSRTLRSTDTELIVPRAVLPAQGKLEVAVRGFAVDYAATPFVDVALAWQDGELEERKIITLDSTTRTATWSVPIGDRTRRKYHYAITYNLADGTRVAGPKGDSDDPVISVTRHQP